MATTDIEFLPAAGPVPAIVDQVVTDLPSAPRRGGRPRSPAANTAIITAVHRLLAEHGPDAMSVEAVAAAAGVGKATIYRRWANKDDLIADALGALNDELPPLPAGLPLRETLIAWVDNIRCSQWDTVSGQIMPRILGSRLEHPALVEVYYERVITPRRRRIIAVMRQAQERGELQETADLDVMATMIVSPILYNAMIRPPSRPLDPDFSREVVDRVLRAFAN